MQGCAVNELSNLPQIVSGFSEKAINESAKLFEEIAKNIIYTTVTKAELAKLFSNTWRYVQFAATNQFYMISHDLGEDYSDIRDLMMENYPRMTGLPSAGFAAGPCLLKDTMQLANLSRNANFMAQVDTLYEGFNLKQSKNLYNIKFAKRELNKALLVKNLLISNRKPVNIINLNDISPKSLGELISLYEHKVFILGQLYGINSYDQWGVEIGKMRANNYLKN